MRPRLRIRGAGARRKWGDGVTTYRDRGIGKVLCRIIAFMIPSYRHDIKPSKLSQNHMITNEIEDSPNNNPESNDYELTKSFLTQAIL